MLPDFVSPQADLTTRNTLALPARAEFLATITHPGQFARLVHHPDLAGRRRFILGGGSNLVLRGDFPGLVVHMDIKGKEFVGEDGENYYVAAAAGERWHEFVLWTLAQGWPGLENLLGIPGTAGAAPIQNIGAYGAEIADFLYELEAIDLDSGQSRRFSAADCAFAYRSSLFKREGWHLTGRYAIIRACFRLPRRWRPRIGYGEIALQLAQQGIVRPNPRQLAETVSALRRQKLPDPQCLPNAGSFFQNPLVEADFAAALAHAHPGLPRYPQPDGRVKLAAGWLIEKTGWKGRNLGKAGMYEKQALVLVNRGAATYRDVHDLTRAVREAVFTRFGVHLEPEPVFL
ncbi:MAG: UDP-N-acetylmuramate dehydrogenase [Zoogloeaceae bacterium]|jgi:UDP-N-acetylmuramate dehydrogenase|nr:UDP-N-acetylmuramate dehydrogenase [Zoogloeaceae bacterium]